MKKIIIAIIIVTAAWNIPKLLGQGCSDPGICTTGTLNSSNTQDSTSAIDFIEAGFDELLNANISSEKYRIGIDVVYGVGERKTGIYNLVLRASVRVKEKMMVNIKLPMSYINGSIGTTYGTGDFTVTFQNTFKSGNNLNLSYTIGLVIPTNNANLMINGRPMPMAYQSSLGAFNVLAGLAIRYKQWSAVAGYQHSFGANGNSFLNEAVVLDSTSSEFDPVNTEKVKYFSSQKLMRGSDLIFRIERGFKIKKLQLAVGVLPIIRLSNTSILNSTGTLTEVIGSSGLTLNITAGASYLINRNVYIKINYGSPVVQRKARPDGLTRTTVLIVGVLFKIW